MKSWRVLEVISILAIVALAGTAVEHWHRRPATPTYTVHGLSYGMDVRAARQIPGVTFVWAGMGGRPTPPASPSRLTAYVDGLDGRIVNVYGDSLERDGQTILTAGDPRERIKQYLGPPENETRVGGESGQSSLVYPQQNVEVFCHRGRLEHVEVGHRIDWTQ